MSRASLTAFLETLDKELRGRSDFYRRNTADRREQTFIYLPRVLVEETYEEFKFRGLLNVFEDVKFKKYLETESKRILGVIRSNAKTLLTGRQATIASNANYIKVTLAVEINPQRDTAYNNFIKLKTIYTTELDKFTAGLVDYLEAEYKVILTKTAKQFDKNTYTSRLVLTDERVQRGSDLYEGGHVEGEGILETRIRDAIDTSFNQAYSKRASAEILRSNLKALGLDLEVVRDDSNDSHTFYIQSRVGNQTAGMISGEEKAKLQKQLKTALQKLNSTQPIAGLKGSDSIIERNEKKVLAATAAPFRALKNVDLKGFAQDPKGTYRKANKRGSTKVVKDSPKDRRVRVPAVSLARRQVKSVASSPLALLMDINRQLPSVVQKNMGEPGLVNRTGRFASSVRATDIVTTAQGFLSIGYTYQRNPYQVFESGSSGNWSSADRDPRNLIDKSIREIAVQYAIGRFYTRRV